MKFTLTNYSECRRETTVRKVLWFFSCFSLNPLLLIPFIVLTFACLRAEQNSLDFVVLPPQWNDQSSRKCSTFSDSASYHVDHTQLIYDTLQLPLRIFLISWKTTQKTTLEEIFCDSRSHFTLSKMHRTHTIVIFKLRGSVDGYLGIWQNNKLQDKYS